MAAQVDTIAPGHVVLSGSRQSTPALAEDVNIVDIRQGGIDLNLASSIRSSLAGKNENGLRTLPSLLLWDEQGLKLFEKVTYAPEYYLTNTEIELLKKHSHDIAKDIEDGSILLELGSGNLRKTGLILNALEGIGKNVDYYALDLDRNELARTLQEVEPSHFKHVKCHGLWGTYDDGREWISKPSNVRRPKAILSLGSTIGSFPRHEASDFAREWTHTLRSSPGKARIILGLDGCTDADKVWAAYNDFQGANFRFNHNTLRHANRDLGYGAFELEDWTVRGAWDTENERHVQYLIPMQDVEFEGTKLLRGEKVLLVYSHKYNEEERKRLFERSELREEKSYMNEKGDYGLHVLVSR